jgi:hypothetical protein
MLIGLVVLPRVLLKLVIPQQIVELFQAETVLLPPTLPYFLQILEVDIDLDHLAEDLFEIGQTHAVLASAPTEYLLVAETPVPLDLLHQGYAHICLVTAGLSLLLLGVLEHLIEEIEHQENEVQTRFFGTL